MKQNTSFLMLHLITITLKKLKFYQKSLILNLFLNFYVFILNKKKKRKNKFLKEMLKKSKTKLLQFYTFYKIIQQKRKTEK